MKYTFFIFIYFVSNFCFSQNHIIVDSSTNKIIPYANIKFLKEEKGFYSNEQGRFTITEQSGDSIQISCLGYNNIFKKVNLLRDSIFLTLRIQNLDEIILHTTPPLLKKIGFKKNTLTWFPNADIQFGLLIHPTKKYENLFINTILIPTKKKYFSQKEYTINPKYKSVIKVTLFSNKNNLPYESLLDTPIIINCDQDSDNIISVDISKEHIKFNSNGIFVCIERVGEIDLKGSVLEKKIIRPGLIFTNKTTKDFLTNKSFYKHKLSNGWEILDYKNMNLKKQIYLAIQLELATYED
ncbi:MAG: carboxypeptidase-like regulatory domain-containing protein [Bacteroidota bacterium]